MDFPVILKKKQNGIGDLAGKTPEIPHSAASNQNDLKQFGNENDKPHVLNIFRPNDQTSPSKENNLRHEQAHGVY